MAVRDASRSAKRSRRLPSCQKGKSRFASGSQNRLAERQPVRITFKDPRHGQDAGPAVNLSIRTEAHHLPPMADSFSSTMGRYPRTARSRPRGRQCLRRSRWDDASWMCQFAYRLSDGNASFRIAAFPPTAGSQRASRTPGPPKVR